MPAWVAVDKAIAEAPESAAVIVRDNADAAQAISRGLLIRFKMPRLAGLANSVAPRAAFGRPRFYNLERYRRSDR